MRKTREEKAITLIALIITIVVLLILAVVAINAVTGDGIIQHATNAKTEYEKAQAEENSMLSYYEKYIESQGSADIWDGKTKEKPEIKDDKWYIYTCSEFKFFADFVNGDLTDTEKEGLEITEDTTVYLMSNLDLGARHTNGVWSGTEWTPIGKTSELKFIGIFEGNNHYVKGLYINKESDFAGIFGYSTNTIKNLIIKDSYIENAGICVGGIVGRGEIITNCHNINTTVKQTGSYKIGGIAGQAKIVENCSNTGTIIANSINDGRNNAGGIIGMLVGNGNIKNCKNSGTITGTGKRVGGIIGSANSPVVIEGCINTGMITGIADVGGILGIATVQDGSNNNNLNLSNSYNIGNINGQSGIGGIIGGIAGYNGNVEGCYNIGTITGQQEYGSVIGKFESQTITGNNIKQCFYIATDNGVTGAGNVEDGDSFKPISSVTNFVNELNSATNTGAWSESNQQYPKLSWEK